MKKTHETMYEMTEQKKKAVEKIKTLLKRMPKEENFDPALEIKLGLMVLLLPFCMGNKQFTTFLVEMRNILMSD